MPAIVQVIVTAEYDESDPCGGELGEAIAEQVLTANARHWDASVLTLMRIRAWLRGTGHAHLTSNHERPADSVLEQALSGPNDQRASVS